MRKHHLALEERGKHQPELEGPSCPSALAYLLIYFGEMASRRTSGANGANPITWSDMQAWESLTKRRLDAFDTSLLCRIDDAYLRIMTADE